MSTLLDIAASLTAPLLYGVLVVLALMSAATAVLLGGFVRELTVRRAQRDALRAAVGAGDDVVGVLDALRASPAGLPASVARDLETLGADAPDHVVQRLDARVRALLAPLTLLTRLAPMAGLVATLLPLGPALSRLSDGDVAALADDITVAFIATVVGLVVSCTAFAIGLARRTWYASDAAELELVVLRLADGATR